MHHNYAFLWVLLLGQGNEIRFYRGKIQIIIEIKNISGGNLRLFNVSARNKASKATIVLISSSFAPLYLG